LDIAPRSRGAIFMDEMVNIISVHLRALYASVVYLYHGHTECI